MVRGEVKETDWSEETRTTVLRRAQHRCEVGLEGCTRFRDLQVHHRKRRAHGDHSPENAIVTCYWCHQLSPDAIHSGKIMEHPVFKKPVFVAEFNGWLVRNYQEPVEIAWLRRGVMYEPSS